MAAIMISKLGGSCTPDLKQVSSRAEAGASKLELSRSDILSDQPDKMPRLHVHALGRLTIPVYSKRRECEQRVFLPAPEEKSKEGQPGKH